MLTFNDIYSIATNDEKSLPNMASPIERFLCFALLGIYHSVRARKLSRDTASKIKLDIRHIYDRYYDDKNLIEKRMKAEQTFIKATEGELSELIKSLSPTCDKDAAIIKALELIGRFEGMSSTVLVTTAEKRLRGDAVTLTEKAGNAEMLKSQDELFNRFWQAYPRKVGKPSARKAFAKIQPDEAETELIISAVEKWKKCRQWQDAEKIPHPATWLRDERYNDEPADGTAAKPTKKEASYDLEKFEHDALHKPLEYKKKKGA